MDRNGSLDIYEQYYRNDKKYGFYLREHTWQSIGRVLFIAGVREGDDLRGNPPYLNNTKIYLKLHYTNSIGEIDGYTRYRVIMTPMNTSLYM